MRQSTKLRHRLRARPTLVMPDAFDPLSAMLIAQAGFEAVQCSGYSMAAAQGYPVETNLSFSEALELTRKTVNAVALPVMADGEDGFGDEHKLVQAVREFVAIGVAGINLEDQVLGHWGGERGVVPAEEMLAKLRLARATAERQGDPDLIINARTDALATATDRAAGLAEAARRATMYLEAGADLAFVSGVRTLAEVDALCTTVPGPLSIAAGLPYNIGEFSVAELSARGLARVSLPTLLLFGAVEGMAACLETLGAPDAGIQVAGSRRLSRLHAQG